MRLCVCALAVSCGREQWREADAKLNEATQAARADGFVPMSGPHNTFGAFTAAGTSDWRVHLEAHQTYLLAAACTDGCDSLDFDVREPHGNTIATDTSTSPTARLVLTTPEEGDFHVVFHYGSCRVATCRWVAQLYTKSQ